MTFPNHRPESTRPGRFQGYRSEYIIFRILEGNLIWSLNNLVQFEDPVVDGITSCMVESMMSDDGGAYSKHAE